jgi:hypothetical protein
LLVTTPENSDWARENLFNFLVMEEAPLPKVILPGISRA